MRIINASYEIVGMIDPDLMIQNIERFGRVCYKSERNITEDSSKAFVSRIISSGHESVIEHEKITVKFICDRGVSHEIVRHRIASYSQESTRYCNYAKERFGKELTFIRPSYWLEDSPEYALWLQLMGEIETRYVEMISMGIPPEQARAILPNSLKTEIVVTMNLREWRHFFRLRTSKKAHPQMREIAIPLLQHLKAVLPVIFDDIMVD